MELYESVRNSQSYIINQNPASIVITRITRTRNAHQGLTETTSTLAAQTVRIYAKTQYVKVISVNDAGFQVYKFQKMIAYYNANFQAESELYLDKFSYNGKTYKIVEVNDVLTQNQIVFKEAKIEAIT